MSIFSRRLSDNAPNRRRDNSRQNVDNGGDTYDDNDNYDDSGDNDYSDGGDSGDGGD